MDIATLQTRPTPYTSSLAYNERPTASPTTSDPTDSVQLSPDAQDSIAFTPDGQYSRKESSTRNGVTTTNYYGGVNDHTRMFQEIQTADGIQRNRYNGVTGSLEGRYILNRHSGTETIQQADGTMLTRQVNGNTSGRDSFGDAMESSDARSQWESERPSFNPPQPKQLPL